jgi:UDP-glucose 4-epimerase
MDFDPTLYSGRRVLVTGGLGFLGSNLTLRLFELGADVRVVDSLAEGCGGSVANLAEVTGRVPIHVRDLRETEFIKDAVADCDIIFNLAGRVDHLGSMQDPLGDLEINCRAQLSLLEACRHAKPRVKVVYSSSRQLYGRPLRLPVDETHPIEPVDINGIHKRAAERYHFIYGVYGIRACALRLTNVYGPRQFLRDARQGVLGLFIRQAMDGDEIQLFGGGGQMRDPIFVDDVVDALLRAGLSDGADGQAMNLGSHPVSLRAIAETLLKLTGRGSLREIPFPKDRATIDIGSYYGDYQRATVLLGWQPRTALEEGLRRTIVFFERRREDYW